jgi:hypothetical protein
MDKRQLAAAATPEALVEHVTGHAHPSHSHEPAVTSTREVTYKGHHLVIKTTYQIEVDGHGVRGHMGVTNDGQVHYHAVPNLSFASAVDMVKQLIDTFPDDFDEGGGR